MKWDGAVSCEAACVCLGTRNGCRDPTYGSSVSIVLNFPVLNRRSTPTKMRATSACIQSRRVCDTVYFDNCPYRPCIVHNAVSLRMFQSSSRTAVDTDTRLCVSKKCARSFLVDIQPKKPNQWTWIFDMYLRRVTFVSRESGSSRSRSWRPIFARESSLHRKEVSIDGLMRALRDWNYSSVHGSRIFHVKNYFSTCHRYLMA